MNINTSLTNAQFYVDNFGHGTPQETTPFLFTEKYHPSVLTKQQHSSVDRENTNPPWQPTKNLTKNHLVTCPQYDMSWFPIYKPCPLTGKDDASVNQKGLPTTRTLHQCHRPNTIPQNQCLSTQTDNMSHRQLCQSNEN